MTLGGEEHQQRVADPNWIVDGTQRLPAGELKVKAVQRDRIVAAKGDVVDAEDSDSPHQITKPSPLPLSRTDGRVSGEFGALVDYCSEADQSGSAGLVAAWTTMQEPVC